MIILQGNFGGSSIGYSDGLGQALVAGKDYVCNNPRAPTICYGVGAVHDVFLELQRQINRYASLAKFGRIGVDGKLGASTLVAANQVVTWIASNVPENTLAVIPNKETLAGRADFYVKEFRDTADGRVRPLPSPTTPGVTLPSKPIPSLPEAPPVVTKPPKKPKPSKPPPGELDPFPGGFPDPRLFEKKTAGLPGKLVWWVVGGLALVGIGTVTVMTYRRRRAQPVV